MQITLEQADERIKSLTSQLIAAKEEIKRTRLTIAEALNASGEDAFEMLSNVLKTTVLVTAVGCIPRHLPESDEYAAIVTKNMKHCGVPMCPTCESQCVRDKDHGEHPSDGWNCPSCGMLNVPC